MAKPFAFETADGNQRSEKRALCTPYLTRSTWIVDILCMCLCVVTDTVLYLQDAAWKPSERSTLRAPFLPQNVDRGKQTEKRKEQSHPFLSRLAHSSSSLRNNYRGVSVILKSLPTYLTLGT